MAYISASVRLSEKLMDLLYDDDAELHLYVYRVVDGQRLKPALFHGCPFPKLFDHLRDAYGAGEFHLFIRRGGRLELAGCESLAALLRR